MKWPWQKERVSETENYINEAALFCFTKHHEIVTNLVGTDRLDQIPLEDNLIAVGETTCCFLHFIDRTLSESAPRSRQHRMDRLVIACIAIYASLFERLGGMQKDESYQLAHDQFIQMYNERGEEYASVGEEWFKKLLLRYATHLIEILNDDDPSFVFVADPDHSSFKMVLNAEGLLARGFGDMVKAVPTLFKP